MSETIGDALEDGNPVAAAVCFDGGFGITGSGGPITEDDDMLLERLEQELDCDAIDDDDGKAESVPLLVVMTELMMLDSANKELRAAYRSSETAAGAGTGPVLVAKNPELVCLWNWRRLETLLATAGVKMLDTELLLGGRKAGSSARYRCCEKDRFRGPESSGIAQLSFTCRR